MAYSGPTRSAWQRLNIRLARTPLGAWAYARILHHIDRAAYRLTGGRYTAAELFTGLSLVWLTTRGARSGLARILPLVGTPDGDRIILIASNWGQNRHPAWFHNLRAHPQVTAIWRGRPGTYLARQVEGAEYTACWAKALANYPGYADYRQRTTRAVIPVFVLEPR